MTKEELEELKKEDEVICEFVYKVIGKDVNGYSLYEKIYTNPPKNLQKVYIDEESNLAVLKDLDYVPATTA